MSSGSDLPVTKLYYVGFKKHNNSLLLRFKITVTEFFNYIFMTFHCSNLLYDFFSCELKIFSAWTGNIFCYLCPKAPSPSNLYTSQEKWGTHP